MAPRLTAKQIALIAKAITASQPTPNLYHIAELFDTTRKTVQKIRDEIYRKEVIRDNWKPRKPRRPRRITPEIEEAINYSVRAVPTIYQHELATFIYE
jgi:hypothetical protein